MTDELPVTLANLEPILRGLFADLEMIRHDLTSLDAQFKSMRGAVLVGIADIHSPGPAGKTGDAGPKGDAGEKGEKGDEGRQGALGPPHNVFQPGDPRRP